MPNKKTSTTSRKKSAAAARASAAPALIQCWPTDPMGALPPLQLPAPDLPGAGLATRIIQPATAPPARVHPSDTPEFRYWTAAEALRRCAEFWIASGAAAWNPRIGASIPVRLDDGVDLNAYYSRDDFPLQDIKQGLSFFHDTVRDTRTNKPATVFSGESPDVVSHELGHAILDALKPGLWGLSTTEAAAFHESFGDMSAILTALQLPTVQQAVIEETAGRLNRNSSVSRVAEQLGWGIRQRNPSAVDPDSLRNAANSFVYADPTTLPASGPASVLSRAPHNFSRVFTGAFLEALGGMVRDLGDPPTAENVLQASRDMGRLLVRAVGDAPVRTRFFQAVAEQLVLADAALFKGRYSESLTTALVRRGLLPMRALASAPGVRTIRAAAAAEAAVRFSAVTAGGADAAGAATPESHEPVRVALDGTTLGLPAVLYVDGPAVDDHVHPTGMFKMAADAVEPAHHVAVQSFVEGLMLRGRIAVEPRVARAAPLVKMMSGRRSTHRLVPVADGVELQRITFECGCCEGRGAAAPEGTGEPGE